MKGSVVMCPTAVFPNVRFPPIAVTSCLADILYITRTTPLTVAARVSATLGGILWGLAAAYVLLFALTGFMLTAGPRAYFKVFIIIGGLATNVLLFKRAETFRPLSTLGLMAVSLSLSAAVVGILAYMALDLGQP